MTLDASFEAGFDYGFTFNSELALTDDDGLLIPESIALGGAPTWDGEPGYVVGPDSDEELDYDGESCYCGVTDPDGEP